MSHESLAELLETFAGSQQLRRISAEVDPELEIAAITHRTAAAGGPALLFERVSGHRQVVVTNLFGSDDRLATALGAESIDAFVESIGQLGVSGGRRRWLDRLKQGGPEAAIDRFAPKTVKVAASQQVVRLGNDVDLADLPALRCWPQETVRALGGGLLLTANPDTGQRSLERCPLTIVGRNRLAVVWSPYRPGWLNYQSFRSRGARIPAAVVLGGAPIMMVVAELAVLEAFDTLSMTGLIGQSAVEVACARTQQIEVPAAAEMVLEGYIDPAEPLGDSGQFAASTGFYHQNAECHILHVTAVTHRSNAALPAIVGGRPPSDLAAVERLQTRLIGQHAAALLPELVDLQTVSVAGGQNVLVVSIRKTHPHQARKVAGVLWGLPSLMFCKIILIVDADVPLADSGSVLFHLAANVHPGRDTFVVDGPADPLDHSLAGQQTGQKMGFDATSKLPAEIGRPWPAAARADEATAQQLVQRLAELGLSNPQNPDTATK